MECADEAEVGLNADVRFFGSCSKRHPLFVLIRGVCFNPGSGCVCSYSCLLCVRISSVCSVFNFFHGEIGDLITAILRDGLRKYYRESVCSEKRSMRSDARARVMRSVTNETLRNLSTFPQSSLESLAMYGGNLA